MRNDLSIISALLTLSILSGGSASFAASDPMSAAPNIAPADKEKPVHEPKRLPTSFDDYRLELQRLQTELILKPNDAQLHYKIAEDYRKLAENAQAIDEYTKAINLNQCLWSAYHQLTILSIDQKLLDAMLEKLVKLEIEKPTELLLRVALSEMFEKKSNYYEAAHTLVDCTYKGGVPEKWRIRVNARIHNMLVLAKSQKQQAEDTNASTAANPAGTEEDLDIMPAPLPMPTSKRSIAQAKIKDAKEVRGMGNTPLTP